MNLSSLFSLSNSILNLQSEEDCAFIFSRRINELTHLKSKDKNKGLYRRIGVFFYNIFSRMSIFDSAKINSKYLVYSGTKNQYDSLLSSTKALSVNSSVLSILDGRWLKKSNKHEEYMIFTPKIVVMALCLFILRSISLHKRLKLAGHTDSISLYFDRFCSIYYYIPYFIDLLKSVNPKFVLMSNDHSPANRALLFVAKSLGIKTVYMQHASVSELFPELDFDYSFLDGDRAYQIYRAISLSENDGNLNNFNQKHIFLTGQKKPIKNKMISNSEHNGSCGVGFSHLDSNLFIIKAMDSLLQAFEKCHVRLHPSHSVHNVEKLKNHYLNNDRVFFGLEGKASLENFINSIEVFFGSQTSLHLEIALSGIKCFHIENSVIKNNDYYGYEQAGLVVPICFSDISLPYFLDVGLQQGAREIKAIKKYSETYKTKWFGREGELVNEILKDIDDSLVNRDSISVDCMRKKTDSNLWST